VSAILVVVPFILTYLAVQCFYVDAITNESIPWLKMFDAVGGSAWGSSSRSSSPMR
jgi:hypothetical protein